MMKMGRDMAAWPHGVGRRVLAEVDSTNAEAARIAPNLTGPEWILALRQTAARGASRPSTTGRTSTTGSRD